MSELGENDEAAEQSMQRLRLQIRLRSAQIAVDALTEVAADKKAPAPARATAGVALLRAAGFFAPGQDGGAGKQPHEMTANELTAALRNAKREFAAIERRMPKKTGNPDPDDGIFG